MSEKGIYLLLAAVLLWFVAAGAFSAEPTLAQPTFAGEQPLGGPIIYDLIPEYGHLVYSDDKEEDLHGGPR